MTRLLVVDDDAALARALEINFAAHEVFVAHTGRAALDLFAHQHPHLVVLDLGLPDLDGVEVLARSRGYSATPIIVLSARATSSEKVRALDAGADDYVTRALMEILARHAGQLVPSAQLLREVWGPTYQSQTHYLRVYLAQLRRKLEPDPAKPRYLITVPGSGYRLELR